MKYTDSLIHSIAASSHSHLNKSNTHFLKIKVLYKSVLLWSCWLASWLVDSAAARGPTKEHPAQACNPLHGWTHHYTLPFLEVLWLSPVTPGREEITLSSDAPNNVHIARVANKLYVWDIQWRTASNLQQASCSVEVVKYNKLNRKCSSFSMEAERWSDVWVGHVCLFIYCQVSRQGSFVAKTGIIWVSHVAHHQQNQAHLLHTAFMTSPFMTCHKDG